MRWGVCRQQRGVYWKEWKYRILRRVSECWHVPSVDIGLTKVANFVDRGMTRDEDSLAQQCCSMDREYKRTKLV